MQVVWIRSLGREDPLEKGAAAYSRTLAGELHAQRRLAGAAVHEGAKSRTRLSNGFPGGSDSKEAASNAGDLGSIPGLERSPGGEYGNPPQYSCLENPHGQGSLVGYSPWDHEELDMNEQLSTAQCLKDTVSTLKKKVN